MVEALLKAGADPNASLSRGQTILMTAARTGSGEAVRLLLARGADVNAREQILGETALIWAAAENHPAVIKALVERGADVNGRSKAMTYPLREYHSPATAGNQAAHRAAARRLDAPVMRLVRTHDRRVRARSPMRMPIDLTDPTATAALVVAISTHYDLAAVLLEHGAPTPASAT
jgi:ankyrin repeat protein